MAATGDTKAATGVSAPEPSKWRHEKNTSSRFHRIAVFCGSSVGKSPVFLEAAQALGDEMGKRGIGLVYGGGSVGLMGKIANTVYAHLGEGSVLGVIPKEMEALEVSGEAIGEVHVVDDMHERKALMSKASDAFICLPGGYGTLEEGIEMLTWLQLGYHQKPVAFLNIDGFYDHLLAFFDHCTTQGFVRDTSRAMLLSSTTPAAIIDQMEDYRSGPSVLDLARAGKLPEGQRG